MKDLPLIVIINDDGHEAKGLASLIEAAKGLGRILVVAPDGPRSGMSHAITMTVPLRVKKLVEEENFTFYKTNGTPVDCVKLAERVLLKDEKIDLLISGINHGSNSATSVLYSGTMAAAIEASFANVPALGFSLLSFDPDADFTYSIKVARKIIKNVLKEGLPERVSLNINIPYVDEKDCKGMKITRQAKGYWKEELVPYEDPHGGIYYWLTGSFVNLDNEEDTDEWALANNYVSIQPVQHDMTAHQHINELKKWEEEID